MQESQRPYPGYLERVAERIARTHPKPITSPHEGASHLHAPLARAIEHSRDTLLELSHDIHAHPETGFAEHHAAAAVANLLAADGIDATLGAWGLDTALHARVGDGGATVAMIAEYDALPDIGHACGHNIICATAVGAFLALARLGDGLEGSVELIATPAEEGGGGKEIIARAGGFDGVDAALMIHPFGMDVADHPWLGVRQVEATYHGMAAHASMMPFMGRNALDAVVQAYSAIAQLRQHMLTSDRVHGIITEGGRAPNVVPERASAHFYIRSAETETLMSLADRVQAILEAAATATGTSLETKWDACPPYLPVRTNRSLAARYAVNLTDRDRQVLPAGLAPPELAASTDMGNISVRLPSIHPLLSVAPVDVIIHTAEFAQWAASERADDATIDGAIALARTGADYLGDAALRRSAAQDFDADGGVLDVVGLVS
jgi:amidohydrolase